MKKYIKNEGKVAIVIIAIAIVVSVGIITYAGKVNALMLAVPEEQYDGGGGGWGPSTPEPAPAPAPTQLPPPDQYPDAGQTANLQWCKNGAKADYVGACDGTTYYLYKVTPAHTNEYCECIGGFDQYTGQCYYELCNSEEIAEEKTLTDTVYNSSKCPVSCTSSANSCGQTSTGTQIGTGPCSATTPPNPANYGKLCLSAENACGQTANGTYNCDGSCSASSPANPANYGKSCTSTANSCGQTNTGTYNCDGSCSASAPANPPNYGTVCTSAPNNAGQTNSGTIKCDGTCSAAKPADIDMTCGGSPKPANFGEACNSTANSCGQTNTGTIQCNGTCSATKPANPSGYGQSCTATNSCGQSNTGTVTCSGTCSVSAPANPANYGKSCTSAANSCGQTNTGTYNCDGTCSASKPSNASCPPSSCTSAPNSCGQTNTGTIVGGVCNATTPANPVNYGKTCTSAANSCGQTNTGTYNCDGTCSASRPSDASCPPSSCTSAPNSCGQTTTGIIVGGVCNAVTPSNPEVYNVIGKCTDPVCTINQTLINHVCIDNPVPPVIPPIVVTNPVDAVCSVTKVDECSTGFYQDTADSGAQHLWICKGIDGGKDASCAINKAVTPTPDVSVTPASSNINEGQTSTFSWVVTNATRCSLYRDGAFIENTVLNRTYTTPVLNSNTNYLLNCINEVGVAPYPSDSGSHSVIVTSASPKAALLTIVERPTQYNNIPFGESHTQKLVLRNDGDLTLKGSLSFTSNPNNAFKIEEVPPEFTLESGQTATFNITYTPHKKSNDLGKVYDNATLLISSNSIDGPKTELLSGTGVELFTGLSVFNVGDVPVGLSKAFTYNVRNNTLTSKIACMKINGASTFSCNTEKTCDVTVGSGKEASFRIFFKPTEIRQFTDSINVGTRENDGSCKTIYDFTIIGNGVKPINIIKEL